MNRRVVATVILFVVATSYLSAQSKTFDFWGLPAFKFGMTEKEVIQVLKKQKRSYRQDDQSRVASAIWVSDQIVDRTLLDGKISIYFLFAGELFQPKKLETVRILWDDWYKDQDRWKGAEALEKKITAFLGHDKDAKTDFKDGWKYSGGCLSVFTHSPDILHLEYGRIAEDQTTIEDVGPSDSLRPPPDFVPYEKEPIVLRKVAPVYPETAMRAGLEGNVYVKVWVDKDGNVRKVVVLKADAEVFEAPAITAAKAWTFTPATMQGKHVDVWVSIPFRFRLTGNR